MRQEISLNQSWYFSKGETIPKTVETAKEQGFCEIQVPHTYNGWDGQDGGGDYYKGKAVYLKEIKKPDIPTDSRVYIEWEGVNSIAEIFINGEKVKEHRGGYLRFG